MRRDGAGRGRSNAAYPAKASGGRCCPGRATARPPPARRRMPTGSHSSARTSGRNSLRHPGRRRNYAHAGGRGYGPRRRRERRLRRGRRMRRHRDKGRTSPRRNTAGRGCRRSRRRGETARRRAPSAHDSLSPFSRRSSTYRICGVVAQARSAGQSERWWGDSALPPPEHGTPLIPTVIMPA